jgi:hypothetical protein
MADQHTASWVGLYLPEDEGEPVALFRDGAHVTALLHQHLGRTDGVVAPADSTAVNADLREQFRAVAEAPAPGGAEPSGIAALRGRIRTRLTEEALEASIEAEEREAMGLPARKDAPKVPDAVAADLGLGDRDAPKARR